VEHKNIKMVHLTEKLGMLAESASSDLLKTFLRLR
jgi:hypothetical protein